MALILAMIVGITSEIIEMKATPVSSQAFSMPTGLFSIMSMMDEMAKTLDSELHRGVVPLPKNPCAQEQLALGCKDASCLKKNLSTLSSACANLIVGHGANAHHSEPSPSPTPQRAFGSLLSFEPFEDVVRVTPDFTSWASSPPTDLMNLLLSNIAGNMPTVFVRQAPRTAVPAPSPVPKPSGHPCENEVGQCARESSSTSREAIEMCLIKHYDELSSNCKCFLHQVLPPEAKKLLPSGPPPITEPAMRVVVGTGGGFAMPAPEMQYEWVHRGHVGQHVVCMLFMPLMILALALLIRRCCLACFAPKPQFAAVVPPEPTLIKTVEPLLAVPIAPVKM